MRRRRAVSVVVDDDHGGDALRPDRGAAGPAAELQREPRRLVALDCVVVVDGEVEAELHNALLEHQLAGSPAGRRAARLVLGAGGKVRGPGGVVHEPPAGFDTAHAAPRPAHGHA